MSLKTSLSYLSTRAITGILSLISLSLLTRALSPVGYAWLSLVSATAAIAGGILIQPIHQSLARFLPRPGFGALPQTLLGLLGGMSAALLLAALLGEWTMFSFLAPGILLGAWALTSAQGIFDFSAQHLNSSMNSRRYGLLLISKSCFFLCSACIVLYFELTPGAALIGMLSSFVLASMLVRAPVWAMPWRAQWQAQLLPTIWPYAWPLGLAVSLNALTQMADRFILAAYLDQSSLGSYSAVSDVIQQTVGLIGSALFLANYPRMVGLVEQGHTSASNVSQAFSQYASLTLACVLPITLCMSLLSTPIVTYFFGHAYAHTGQQIMPWLAVSALLGCIRSYVLEIPLHLGNRMRALLGNVALCALSICASNLWLTPRYGVIGAGAAAVLAQSLGCLSALYISRKSRLLRIKWRDLAALGLSSIVMVSLLRLLPSSNILELLACVSLASAAYLSCLYGLDFVNLRSRKGLAR